MPTDSTNQRLARLWLGIAVLVLVLAGLFALLLVVARMPPFDRLVTDPGFFRRCLVVHVDLALVLWFYSFVASLLFLLPERRNGALLSRLSPHLAVVGIALLSIGAWLPGTKPVMSNYIPMIDHWVFGLGLATFGSAVIAVVLSLELFRSAAPQVWLPAPSGALAALRTAVVALLLAGLTLFSTWLALPEGLEAQPHYELLYWGMGHVLQLVSVAAMLAVWQILVASRTGSAPIPARSSVLWLALLLLPWLVAPLLPIGGAWRPLYHTGFTRLMQFGLAPAVLAFGWLCVRALRRAPAPARRGGILHDPATSGFVASAVLTLIGFVLGASIHGSNTVVPGHYHANIGAVTVAFMAASYLLLEPLGLQLPGGRFGRLAGWQPSLYGLGQIVFAAGFALAGTRGSARKVYGQEQGQRDALETAGLFVMGVGGFIAIAGGLLFLALLGAAWLRRPGHARIATTLVTAS